jgi:hypothetical protein
MIVRVQKEKRLRFTIISNMPIEDGRLSWESLGLLTYLLTSRTTGRSRSGISRAKNEPALIRSARMLRELADTGYCKRKLVHGRTGKFAWKSTGR